MNNTTPYDDFHGSQYLLHNKARFDHLNDLELPIKNKSILEAGAGIGDHTEFLLQHNPTQILSIEARKENIDILSDRFHNTSEVTIKNMNLDDPGQLSDSYDICYCYGLLYHLENPEAALKFLSEHTRELFLLETCVDYINEDSINLINEDRKQYSQSFTGTGCRPGRIWLFKQLKELFDHVYMPKTQPDHAQFPTDWKQDQPPSGLCRAIFIASRSPVPNTKLCSDIPYTQTKTSNNK